MAKIRVGDLAKELNLKSGEVLARLREMGAAVKTNLSTVEEDLAHRLRSALTGADKKPVVGMETSMGTIKIELYPHQAPATVENFLGYVNDKFYDGTIFHRVIPTFLIQGGGMVPGLREKQTKAPIKNESANGLSNQKYTLAMARTGVPDSATSQFFINLKDNQFLDRANSRDGVGYCVFGKVIEGQDVVDKIAKVKTASRGVHGDVPAEDVTIKSVRRADSGQGQK